MAKHFETLWEEVEKFSIHTAPTKTSAQTISELKEAVGNFSTNISSRELGLVLFQLCEISIRLNINTYAALQKELQDRKIDDLDT